jgi:hypothetical protein
LSSMDYRRCVSSTCWLALALVGSALAAEELAIDPPADFGGPNSVPNIIEADARPGERWDDTRLGVEGTSSGLNTRVLLLLE